MHGRGDVEIVSHFRSQKLIDSAEDKPCAICGAVGTTIAAHANSVALGKGTGIKVPDYYTAWLCDVCHAMVDGRLGKLTKAEKWDMWVTAYLRTISRWFQEGIVCVK